MASKDNSLVYSLSVFVLLSLGFGVAWYFSWDFSNQLKQKLAETTKSESTAKSAIRNLQADTESLRALVGQPGATDEVVASTQALVAKYAADPSLASSPAEQAMINNAAGRDAASLAATERLQQTNAKIVEISNQVASHETALKGMKASLEQKEQELRTKETQHAAKLEEEEKGIDSKKTDLRAEQDRYTTFVKASEEEKDNLNKEISRQRKALIVLRREKLKLEGATFERADANITMVDATTSRVYVDLGSLDQLRVGTEFSVYSVGSREVGQALNARDKKGKIEIVALLEDHLAEARIVSQKETAPLSPGDFIYSSLFERGQPLQIAIVGVLDFDGNPGNDREEFHRITSASGINVAIEVDDDARILGNAGEVLTAADIPVRITAATRFLVIGGAPNKVGADEARTLIATQIEEHQRAMIRAAESSGVYVLSLSSFLDFIGYSSKRLVNSEISGSPR